MFYSHEVLTSRKHGVATVWLVATLGSKSSVKKINRKAISNVDVPKACRTIVDPGAPMALRLQGNLLYGVVRVYQQQCGYILSDAQNTYNGMRMMLKVMKDAGLDPEAGKAKPGQLILQDDPSFMPEIAFPPPDLFADLNLGLTPPSGDSQSLTPFGTQQRQRSQDVPIANLMLPSSSPGGDGFHIAGENAPGSFGGPSSIAGGEPMMQFEDPDFDFDAEGNMVNVTPSNVLPGTPAARGAGTVSTDVGTDARVRSAHEEGQRAESQRPESEMELDLPMLGDDLPEGEVPPTDVQMQNAEEPVQILESSSAASAPMRQRKRAARILPADTTMELRNRDLINWNNNYLENMKEASRLKSHSKISQLAKKNAEMYVWGAGIGGIGRQFSGLDLPTPLDSFYGDGLFERFTGIDRKKMMAAAKKKHDRDSGIDEATQEEAQRRVRPRIGGEQDEQQIGRGGVDDNDEAMFIQGADDADVELPRDAPSALDDQQIFSAMPWNMSASARGSSAIPKSSRAGGVGAGVAGSTDQARRRGSRIVSASPLHGRGQAGGLEALAGFEGGEDDDFGSFGGDYDNDFGFGGPPSGPSSEAVEGHAATNQAFARVQEALSAEGDNFLTFVTDAITEKRNRIQSGLEAVPEDDEDMQAQAELAAANVDEVTFEEILPPAENSTMVACQGLMMVLTMGSKGILDVRQDEPFGEIGLSLTEKGRAMQVIEISDAERESSSSDGGEEEEEDYDDGNENENEGRMAEEGDQGYFEEQFAAVHG